MTADPYAGHCTEGERCVCGGDLPRVRAGCGAWVKDSLKQGVQAHEAAEKFGPNPVRTLRDEFAMAAIREASGGAFKAELIAKRAYEIADAMMAEREQ